MDFNKIFKYSWDLFLKDVVALIIGGLIVGIVGVFTLGILAGPLLGGLVKMILRRVRENRPAEIGDVFSAMDQFGTLFIATLVIGLLTVIGLIFCIIPGLLLATIWMYVIIFIVDKKLSMVEAMSSSKALVSRVGFGMHLVMILIMGFISGILSVTYIGSFVATPFIMVVVCVMYFLFNNEEQLLINVTSTGSQLSNYSSTPTNNQPPVVQQSIDNPPVVSVPPPSPPQAQQVQKIAMLVCVSCGNKAGTGAFCIECGVPLKVGCSNCRKELILSARFCSSCGSKLE